MEKHSDLSMKDIQNQLLEMAFNVIKAIDAAIASLHTRDVEKIKNVYEIEQLINLEQINLDDSCVKHLALQQPMAVDLRVVVAIIKINSDLERMGDQAVNIAHNVERYLRAEPLKPLIDLPKMCEEVKFMVREALNSFAKRD